MEGTKHHFVANLIYDFVCMGSFGVMCLSNLGEQQIVSCVGNVILQLRDHGFGSRPSRLKLGGEV